MGIFDKLFGKKETEPEIKSESDREAVQPKKGDKFISTGDNNGYKIIRDLTDDQKEAVEKSTILLRVSQLYTHYWTKNLVCTDRNDQEWRNMVMFFWKAEEPFPKKSLPSHFENFETKFFIFQGDTSKVTLNVGKAAPWFGMPGLGEKHLCLIDNQEVTIPELYDMGLVDYLEFIELANENLDVLTNKEEYFFLVDEGITPFRNGNFYLKDKPVPISIAYSIGGIHIIKKSKLE